MILEIDKNNENHIECLKKFVEDINTPYFRYFKTRVFEQAINNHIYTILHTENSDINGYGHIDFNKEQDKFFIGLCVISNKQNQGIGTMLLKSLIERAIKLRIDLYLTVDKENLIAASLYKKFGFTCIGEKEHYYEYKYTV